MSLVTSTETVQSEPAATVPPLRLIVPPPSGAVTTPAPQVVEALAGVAMNVAPGNVSEGDAGKVLVVAGESPGSFAVEIRGDQACEQLGFSAEAFHALRVRGELLGQNFDGNVAIEFGIACAVHNAHASLAYLFDDFVMGEPGPLHVTTNLCWATSLSQKCAGW